MRAYLKIRVSKYKGDGDARPRRFLDRSRAPMDDAVCENNSRAGTAGQRSDVLVCLLIWQSRFQWCWCILFLWVPCKCSSKFVLEQRWKSIRNMNIPPGGNQTHGITAAQTKSANSRPKIKIGSTNVCRIAITHKTPLETAHASDRMHTCEIAWIMGTWHHVQAAVCGRRVC